MTTGTGERVLVVGPAWVGDMVMAQSLFRLLHETRPGVEVDVLAPEWSAPLLARMPELRYTVTLPVEHGRLELRRRWRIGRKLRQRNYHQAIVIPRSYKSALVPFLARVPRRTGYRGEHRYGLLNDIRPLDRELLRQTVQRYNALGLPPEAELPPPVPYPALQIDTDNRARLVETLGLDTTRPVVAFMPGAEYGPAKQWPLAHFAELAGRLARAGRQVWILGSQKDRAAAETITTSINQSAPVNLCGRTRLEDAIDLLSLCAAAVSNDSGLMHVAAAVGVPVVGIYGSSTPDYTPPLTARAAVLYRGLECSPCFRRTCRYGHTACLTGIPASEAVEALENLMEG